MLHSIRGKFAVVLLLGLAFGCLAGVGLQATNGDGGSDFSQPALVIGTLTLVVMLLVERIVINPITNLTRDVVAIKNAEASVRLRVKGNDEVATLGTAFNDLLEHLEERKRLEAQLLHMARHDALTGLPNRVLFQEHLGQELARGGRRGEDLALLCIDLDLFKEVNDT
ncbi:MAG TPA: diguanylate cyclase, partial [Beijerinckiaceae bacterium]|nr:diguanylate cyclase [Beijerinckiaceae bacterium]